jgi:DNA polymerase-1
MPVVPDARDFHPSLNAWLCTGHCAFTAVAEMPEHLTVAIDIETPSVTDSFTLKCVTAAWVDRGITTAVLLDPARRPSDRLTVLALCRKARYLVLHGSDFDIPGLVHAGCMDMSDIAKVVDTLIYARSAFPDTLYGKSLEELATKILNAPTLKGGLALAIKAAGFHSKTEWYAKADIDMPFYRFNAMVDTIITLRLLEPLIAAAEDRQLDHPFSSRGCVTRGEAFALVQKYQRVNRIVLRGRSVPGLAVDLEYLDRYRDTVDAEVIRQSAILTDAGLRPGVGADLVTYLDKCGQLPGDWPRTEKTGRLSAAKEHVEWLSHPLADAHRAVFDAHKVLGYLEKTVARSAITGRLHPQIHILGASATGRMSVSEPELQQFPDAARPIIIENQPGSGITSVDWSSIEPALLAWAAEDLDFIGPFERGADLYEPITRACNIVRPKAKTVLLAQLYGQGITNMALRIGSDADQAKRIRAQMFAAMPGCAKFMTKLKIIAEQYRVIITVGGRVLPIPIVFDKRISRKVVASHKAVNFFCQGSNADLIYDAVLEAEAEGLGDALLLQMHDEILCDTAAGDDLERIMQTPPESLKRWTDHVPVIRTDRHDLGRSWRKC